MSSVKIVFWTGTGNTAAMAEAVAQGVKEAGAEAELISVDKVNVAELVQDNAFALGCPSMGAEQLEEGEMEPFMCELDGQISGKKVGLFGSYGWGNQEWMRDWEDRVAKDGATVVNGGGIATKDYPDDEALANCVALGKALAASL